MSTTSSAPPASSPSATAARYGLGVGTVLAMIISWGQHESILLALFHGLLSWLYVLYFALTR